jgi:2-hydroxy-6-oxonona-2,4-dienedioate hydrolase
MSTLWKSEDGKARMREWFGRFRALLPSEVRDAQVETSFGSTHLLVGGPESGPPVVLLHGALATSAHVLVELEDLMKDHRVYAVDVLGQSVMSAEVRLPVGDESYGDWLVEVLDALHLEGASVIGVSWGGFVAQRLAARAPERIHALVLLVPAGVVPSPRWQGFLRMGWPLTRFLLAPKPARLAALAKNLLTTSDDPMWVPFLGDAFTFANLKGMEVPPLSRPGEFLGLRAPVFVIAADRDVSFPGDAVLAQARVLFPTLAGAHLLIDTQHSPPTTPEARREMATRVADFLARARTGEVGAARDELASP